MLLNRPPIQEGLAIRDGQARFGKGFTEWFTQVFNMCFIVKRSGATADRPTANLETGMMYFDTTLGKPCWVNAAGTGWVDATGAAV